MDICPKTILSRHLEVLLRNRLFYLAKESHMNNYNTNSYGMADSDYRGGQNLSKVHNFIIFHSADTFSVPS